MRRSQRLIAAIVLIALSSALAGCSSIYSWDPSDLLDFLDTKKKLPGERKPVFPEGVPGLEQGVPKDLYKGNAEQQQQQAAQQAAAAAAAPAPEEPKAKHAAKSKGKTSSPATAATEPAAAPDPDAAPEEDGSTAAAPPAPKPKKIVRKRTTAPPQPRNTATAMPMWHPLTLRRNRKGWATTAAVTPLQPGADSGQPCSSEGPVACAAGLFLWVVIGVSRPIGLKRVASAPRLLPGRNSSFRP